MHYRYSSKLGWDKREKTHHVVDLELDLSLDGIFKSRRIAEELAREQASIRAEVFAMIAGQIVPTILAGTGEDYSLPAEGIHSKAKSEWKDEQTFQEPSSEGDTLKLQDRVRVVMGVETDRPVTGVQAAYSGRAGLADAITERVMHSLNSRYLGITRQESTSESRMAGDDVVGYAARSKTDFTGN